MIAADRQRYSAQIQEIYRSLGFEFEAIRGDYKQRFDRAVELVDRMLENVNEREADHV